jgi:hypothetical protein
MSQAHQPISEDAVLSILAWVLLFAGIWLWSPAICFSSSVVSFTGECARRIRLARGEP